MTLLTAREVAYWWEFEGGPRSRDVEWVAIAMGESGLDDSAVSSAGAIGLWQIMPFHAAEYGFEVSALYQPQVNASIAVQLSGHGTNCAAWDSCYADIYASGRYSFLAWPERGSADYNNLPAAANELGQNPPYTKSVAPPPWYSSDYAQALAHNQYMTQRVLPGIARGALRDRRAIDKLFQRGWRP